jgi:hypothetical protein
MQISWLLTWAGGPAYASFALSRVPRPSSAWAGVLAGWPTLRLVVGDATTNVAAPSFAVFEGWEARTINLTDDGP